VVPSTTACTSFASTYSRTHVTLSALDPVDDVDLP
jgi:hypothetical protein